jgi:hypothetical protein
MSDVAPESHERLQRAMSLEEHEPIFRRVAVLLALVTLLAGGAGYLERSAATSQAKADLQARKKAIEAVSAGVKADVLQRERETLRLGAFDVQTQADSFKGQKTPLGDALAAAYGRAAQQLRTWSDGFFGSDLVSNGRFDTVAFKTQNNFARHSKQEWQAASARERGSWASKRGDFVLAITLFAVSLFLLGITLTAPRSSRRAFLLFGCAFAVGGLALALETWASSVYRPSAAAIAALARAEAADDADAPASEIVDNASTAIAYRHDYAAAYDLRGRVRLNEGFDRSDEDELRAARGDLRAAIRLDRGDYFAWANLSRALFLLHDDAGAARAADSAWSLEPNRPAVNLYRLLYRVVTGVERRPSLASLVTRLKPVPIDAWDSAFETTETYADRALRRRERLPDRAALESLLRQLEAFQARVDSYGDFTAPSTRPAVTAVRSVKLVATGGHERGGVAVTFDYTGLPSGAPRLYYLFVNGVHDGTLGPFGGPLTAIDAKPIAESDNDFSVTLEESDGLDPGDRVRAVVFLDAKRVAACTFTVPASGGIDPQAACRWSGSEGSPIASPEPSRPAPATG